MTTLTTRAPAAADSPRPSMTCCGPPAHHPPPPAPPPPRDRLRPLLAAAADRDRHPRLHRLGDVRRVLRAVVLALEAAALLRQHRPDDAHALREAVGGGL